MKPSILFDTSSWTAPRSFIEPIIYGVFLTFGLDLMCQILGSSSPDTFALPKKLNPEILLTMLAAFIGVAFFKRAFQGRTLGALLVAPVCLILGVAVHAGELGKSLAGFASDFGLGFLVYYVMLFVGLHGGTILFTIWGSALYFFCHILFFEITAHLGKKA